MTAAHADVPALAELPAFWPAGEPLRPGTLPAGTARLVARSALGVTTGVEVAAGEDAVLAGLGPATWAVEAQAADGTLLAD